jgi:hypothetical protein
MNSCGIYNFHLVELPPVDDPPEAFFVSFFNRGFFARTSASVLANACGS